MALSNIGSVVGTDILPTQVYTSGNRVIGPQAIPAGFTVILTSIDLRQVTTLTPVFTQTVEVSFDGGTNWVLAGGSGLDLSKSGYTVPGGVLTGPSGEPIRSTSFWTRLPQPQSANRTVRINLNLSQSATVGVALMAW